MKDETSNNIKQSNNNIQSKKAAFRQHQKNLPFTEKMQIAFSLAQRDKTIRRAVLLPKKKEDK